MTKKIIALSVLLIIMLNAAFPALAAESRAISISKVEGSDVTMTKGAAKSFAAKSGMGLFDGYTVSTGKGSSCSLKMDESSVAKMDASSKIKIVKSSSNLSISVLSGGLSVNAAAQKSGESVRVSAGNSTLAIRGTLFTAELASDGKLVITMISGSGDVDGNIIVAGNVMYVYDTVNDKLHEIIDVKIDESLSAFTLKTINDHKDELIDAGIFTEEDFLKLPELIERKEAEQEEQELNEPVFEVEKTPEYLSETTSTGSSGGSGSGSSGGGGSTPTPPPTPPATEVSGLINAATSGDTVTVTGNSVVSSPATLAGGVTLEIASGATLNVNSTLTFDPTSYIDNYGTINNNTSTSIHNSGDLTNYGRIVNGASGLFVNGYGLHNDGEIVINGGTFTLNSPCGGMSSGATIIYNGGTISGSSLINFRDPLVSGYTYVWNTGTTQWENSVAYTLIYSSNQGSGTVGPPQQIPPGAEFNAASTAGLTPPAGMKFKEWNTNAAGTGTGYAVGATVIMPGSDLTLYAIWEDDADISAAINSETGTLTLVENSNVNSSATLQSGAVIDLNGYTLTVNSALTVQGGIDVGSGELRINSGGSIDLTSGALNGVTAVSRIVFDPASSVTGGYFLASDGATLLADLGVPGKTFMWDGLDWVEVV